MTPDEYCARNAMPPGSSLYYAVRVLPPRRRRAIAAVHAFCRHVRDVARTVADPRVARLKLEWWRTEVDAAFAGRPQHPVARTLAPALSASGLPRACFASVIDGVAADCERCAPASFAALEEHCRAIAGSVWELSAMICGYRDAATRDHARELGVALRLTAIIRDLGADLRRGRIYLPGDELARFGVDVTGLLRREPGHGFGALMALQAERARGRYASALAVLPAADRRRQRAGLIMAALGAALLAEIERDDFRVLDRRIALTPLAKAWIAWKTSWAR